MIPIFTQFDKWIGYANSEFEDYTLYKAQSTKTHITLSKRYNVLFGLFSKQLNNVEFKLINCKKPSFVVDCDYSTIVKNKYGILKSPTRLNQIRVYKIINNVVIGLLEKGIIKVQSSCIFHTLEEARGYQNFNGVITMQSEVTSVEIVESCPKMNEIH